MASVAKQRNGSPPFLLSSSNLNQNFHVVQKEKSDLAWQGLGVFDALVSRCFDVLDSFFLDGV